MNGCKLIQKVGFSVNESFPQKFNLFEGLILSRSRLLIQVVYTEYNPNVNNVT